MGSAEEGFRLGEALAGPLAPVWGPEAGARGAVAERRDDRWSHIWEDSTRHLEENAHVTFYPPVPSQSLLNSVSCAPALPQPLGHLFRGCLCPQQEQVKEEQCLALFLTMAV